MDINTLRGLATLFALIAFCAVCWWAYSGNRKQAFDEAANLPFADDRPPADNDADNRADISADNNANH